MAIGLRFALLRDHVQQIDLGGLQAWDVLEHADHFLDMTLAGIGDQKVPEQLVMERPLPKPMGRIPAQRQADGTALRGPCGA